MYSVSFTIGNPEKRFLTKWPWSLTYDLDLQTWLRYPSTWPTYRNSSLYVCPFSRESGNTQTHTHTHKRCQNYYTRHVTYVTWGVKKEVHSPPKKSYHLLEQMNPSFLRICFHTEVLMGKSYIVYVERVPISLYTPECICSVPAVHWQCIGSVPAV